MAAPVPARQPIAGRGAVQTAAAPGLAIAKDARYREADKRSRIARTLGHAYAARCEQLDPVARVPSLLTSAAGWRRLESTLDPASKEPLRHVFGPRGMEADAGAARHRLGA
jgi:hypothetical protein